MNRRRDEAAAKGGERLLEPILALHNAIRGAVVEACERQKPERLAATAGDHGDTIYAIDRVAEQALSAGLNGLPEPVCVIAEGLATKETAAPPAGPTSSCPSRRRFPGSSSICPTSSGPSKAQG